MLISSLVIEFSIGSIDEMGFDTSKKLIIEIMGRHSNIILTDEDIKIRMNNAKKELQYIKDYDYIVVNDHLNSAITSVNEIINAEKHKVFREENLVFEED